MNNPDWKKLCISLDSRLVKLGDYFVPVVGEKLDGHDFIDKAYENGAAGILEVGELYSIATEKLKGINPRVIAITGSVGKSTMRDFVSCLLGAKYKVCRGTLNTKLGLAVNIINDLSPNDKFLVAETGMDKLGELRETGQFLRPDAAVITNISESHMEKLGTLENIKRAKFEIVETLREDGYVFLNWDSENIRDAAKNMRKLITAITYGNGSESKYNPEYVCKLINSCEFKKVGKISEFPFKFIGSHNYANVIGAMAVAVEFGVPACDIVKKFKDLKNPKGRLNLIEGCGGSTIVDDTYNSSPVSARCALEAVAEYYDGHALDGRKIAVLGGMLELGGFETEGHKQVGNEVLEHRYDVLVVVGELAKKFIQGPDFKSSDIEVHGITDNIAAGKFIKDKLSPKTGDIILVKGSQGIRLEKAVEMIMENPERAEDLLVRQDVRWN